MADDDEQGQAPKRELPDIQIRAKRRFDAIWTAQRDERLQSLEDRRFASIPGAQWEGALGDQFANLPRFEVNKVQLAITRIYSEYRNNRITVDFRPKDHDTSEDLSDTLDGLYRADEQDSSAQEAYDNALEEGVAGGFGGWRLRACEEDEGDPENDRQRIVIEPVYDADIRLFFDLDAKRYDKADARHAFLLTQMSPERYEEEYPDHPAPADWDAPESEDKFDWFAPDVVTVAEYYEIEDERVDISVYRHAMTGEEQRLRKDTVDAKKRDMLAATGFRWVAKKTITQRRVHKYVLNGAEVIEDCGLIAGRSIPLVPYFGRRWYVEGIERCAGHVRVLKDAQRLKNMQLSRIAHIAALSPTERPIVTPEQISGHEVMWAEANVKEYPYALLNPLTDASGNIVTAGPVGYTKPPSIPPALAAVMQSVDVDLQDLMGNPQQAEQLQANVSAKAVELVQSRHDMQSFLYLDNMAKSMRRCGEIWRSMAADVYVEEGRAMKVVTEAGEGGFVTLLEPGYDEATGAAKPRNDLAQGQFDVIADVGPSFQSRRDATVRGLSGMMQVATDPETASVLMSLALINMDGEGLSDARKYFRKRLLRAGVVTPTDAEKDELAAEGQQQDPQAQLAGSLAEEATANAAQARAKTVQTIADAELKQAQTAKTWAEVNQPPDLLQRQPQ